MSWSLNFSLKMLYLSLIYVLHILVFLYFNGSFMRELLFGRYNSLNQAYDYIVVGAGSAGSVIAGRLVESGKHSVLLLEAGSDCTPFYLDIPVITPLLQLSSIDWQYRTETQSEACFGLKDNSSHWPMGKIVGGSSRLNSIIYLRGVEKDFHLWKQMFAKDKFSWDYDREVLKLFKRTENQIGRYKSDINYHARGGPLPVEDLPWVTPLGDAVLQAGVELGFSITDLNRMDQIGFMKAQVNMMNGTRWSADKFFGNMRSHDFKLRVVPFAVVEKVLFNEIGAYGVLYSHLGVRRTVHATKAVILSAGVIGSAKILMHSGIGPRKHLQSLKIPVVKDLPVGQNLQDHVTTGLDLVVLNQTLPLSIQRVASLSAALEYFWSGTGPWTFPGCEAVAIFHSRLVNSSLDPPDLQIMALPTGMSGDYGAHLRNSVGISDKVWNEYFIPLYGQQVVSLLPVLLHPKSHGEVLLRSRYPEDLPLINPHYLQHKSDVEALYEGILMVKKLISTEAFQALGAKLYNKSFPGCEHLIFDTKSYWLCYIRHLTLTSYHPVGTCKMGDSSDPTAVVDTQFRVHGVQRLHVVDASVIPTLPSANIHATVLMLAEKAAELIKQNLSQNKMKCFKSEVFMPNSEL